MLLEHQTIYNKIRWSYYRLLINIQYNHKRKKDNEKTKDIISSLILYIKLISKIMFIYDQTY